ncbi:MAG TPA: hypothetical protein VF802_03450, partial [Candidatus Limnocylindrales bacterium]
GADVLIVGSGLFGAGMDLPAEVSAIRELAETAADSTDARAEIAKDDAADGDDPGVVRGVSIDRA